MRRSKAVVEVLEAIRKEPGITKKELAERLTYHPFTIVYCLRALLTEKYAEGIQYRQTYRYYPFGKAPESDAKTIHSVRGFWQEESPINKAGGRKFIDAFDAEYNLKPILISREAMQRWDDFYNPIHTEQAGVMIPRHPNIPATSGTETMLGDGQVSAISPPFHQSSQSRRAQNCGITGGRHLR